MTVDEIARRLTQHWDDDLRHELIKISVVAVQKLGRRNWFRHGHHDLAEMTTYMLPYVVHYYDHGDPESGLEPGDKVGAVYRATKDAYAHGYGERPLGPQRKGKGFEWADHLDYVLYCNEDGTEFSLGMTLEGGEVDPGYEDVEGELWLHQKLAELREVMDPKEYQRVIDRLYTLEKKRWQTPSVTREEVLS